MDGVVDTKDLCILSRNYGKTFSVLSLGGIAAIAGIQIVKHERDRPRQAKATALLSFLRVLHKQRLLRADQRAA